VGGVRRAHSKLKISAAEANSSYDKLKVHCQREFLVG
jgi:hypothetical protein